MLRPAVGFLSDASFEMLGDHSKIRPLLPARLQHVPEMLNELPVLMGTLVPWIIAAVKFSNSLVIRGRTGNPMSAVLPAFFGTQDERHGNTMNPSTNIQRITAPPQLKASAYQPQATVLVATNDLEIRENVGELLQLFPLKILWARGLEEVKSALIGESVTACLCGFWLVDGTYRDVVRQLRIQPVEIPAIIVCAPSCPHEYRDYLAALNIRAFDFICHPYRKSDVERILRSAIDAHDGSERLRRTSGSHSVAAQVDSGLRRAS
jgi:hypothetical protein